MWNGIVVWMNKMDDPHRESYPGYMNLPVMSIRIFHSNDSVFMWKCIRYTIQTNLEGITQKNHILMNKNGWFSWWELSRGFVGKFFDCFYQLLGDVWHDFWDKDGVWAQRVTFRLFFCVRWCPHFTSGRPRGDRTPHTHWHVGATGSQAHIVSFLSFSPFSLIFPIKKFREHVYLGSLSWLVVYRCSTPESG